MKERIERHDGLLLSPCPHCATKPKVVELLGGRKIACPNPDCLLSTDYHWDVPSLLAEWDDIVLNWR